MHKSSLILVSLALAFAGVSVLAQQQALPPAKQQTPQAAPPPTPAPTPGPPTDGKIRVYVTDSHSWEMSGGWGAGNGAGGGLESGGARPQTAEIIKTFGERCPEVTVTNNKARGNYAVILDHEGGKGALRKDNKVAVFNRDGDAIFSHSTVTLGNAVKDACSAIRKDQASQKK